MAAVSLIPGEEVPSDRLPKAKKGTLTLGPGLRHILPSTISATTPGVLQVDHKKAAVWLEYPNGRYQPSVGDLVVAQIHHSTSEAYSCIVTPHTPFALLGQLAFEGANKKTRPQLKAGDMVYARVSRASKYEETELECVSASTGKADGMGPLKGGMVFDVSPSFARRLMMGNGKGGVIVLDEVGEKARFEVAVGRNGRLWLDSGSVAVTIGIGRLLQQTDEEGWDVEAQKKAVRKLVKDLGG
ncbi:hypothetical protein BAUCODRAFT_67161 [Baudoinia panamericana UAMH 10762]|uniref:Ribosomal RNA-processing protein 40 n=1 Tax=Baudoinia panamericana (strain UAMH 10762) TaxID=717646 RepID=M2MNB8_BAUPA|nr:uncharacterized protein BAUCODRAFT_67161 [Baudoinia panamericana UAMH 10762]EMC98176.1 hypothetical protein BAUCODRAFT_67161 [Baudoinia panamericana UAMH 10762]